MKTADGKALANGTGRRWGSSSSFVFRFCARQGKAVGHGRRQSLLSRPHHRTRSFLVLQTVFSFSFEIKLISFQHLGTPELVRRRHVVTKEAGQEEDVDEEQGRHEQHLSGKDIRPESHPQNVFLTLF